MEEVGRRRERFGEYTAEMAANTGGVTIRWSKAGSPLESAPAVAKKEHAEAWKELQGAARDAEAMLVTVCDRLHHPPLGQVHEPDAPRRTLHHLDLVPRLGPLHPAIQGVVPVLLVGPHILQPTAVLRRQPPQHRRGPVPSSTDAHLRSTSPDPLMGQTHSPPRGLLRPRGAWPASARPECFHRTSGRRPGRCAAGRRTDSAPANQPWCSSSVRWTPATDSPIGRRRNAHQQGRISVGPMRSSSTRSGV